MEDQVLTWYNLHRKFVGVVVIIIIFYWTQSYNVSLYGFNIGNHLFLVS